MNSSRVAVNHRDWLDTTSGAVGVLLFVQFVTGVLLAFYYVPSIDHAHSSVSFIEKVLSSGSWIRSLHHYGSQWLSLLLFLHVIRLYWQEAYEHHLTQWIGALALLGLVMAGGATGYSLPWDARAFFSTRVAEGLMGGLPLAGRLARLWLLGGSEISPLTLSRFFALHVLVTPFLILAVLVWRFGGRFSSTQQFCLPKITRQAVVGGVIFLALAIWCATHPAPLGPPIAEASTDYLPRPGGQFLWLYETLKHIPGGLGSIAGLVMPLLAVVVLLLLAKMPLSVRKLLGGAILGLCALLIVGMTSWSYYNDRKDPRTRQQLARQAAAEQNFRNEPFKPSVLRLDQDPSSSQPLSNTQNGAPAAYVKFCVSCHGPNGEGTRQGALRFPPLVGVAAKPRRQADDIVNLLNDPKAFGLEPPMRSFATKLTDEEKRQIAEWVVKLK